jgi:hypothetical protein
MEEAGDLDTSVAAALLRLINPPDMTTGFTARDIPYSEATEGASGGSRSYYDPTRPSPGKSADI